MQHWMEQPVAYYGALSATVGACLYLFVTTERKLAQFRRKAERRLDAVEEEGRRLGALGATLDARIDACDARTAELAETVAGVAVTRRDAAGTRAIDANQRTQVLRMVRRGERVDHIAAELRVPRHEVELLQKVQRALAKAV